MKNVTGDMAYPSKIEVEASVVSRKQLIKLAAVLAQNGPSPPGLPPPVPSPAERLIHRLFNILENLV